MKKYIYSCLLLLCSTVLVAGKPTHNNRLALILAAQNGDIKTVRRLVENGLVSHRTMNTA